MALTTSFKTDINISLTELSITDTSTAAYAGEAVVSRQLLFEYADGTSEQLDFPIVLGVGDVYVYPTTKDLAVAVTLSLGVLVPVDDSDYSQTTNLLLANRLKAGMDRFRKELFLDKYNDEDSVEFHKAHENLRVLEGFYRTAKQLAVADLKGSAKALEYGTDFLSFTCNS